VQCKDLGISYGFYEVLDSDRAERLAAYNRRAFPDVSMGWGRRFFIGYHDGSARFLAQDLHVEEFDGTFNQALGPRSRTRSPLMPCRGVLACWLRGQSLRLFRRR
jgi:hypothetical protein